jgi:ketosteroid isomerase-like protein
MKRLSAAAAILIIGVIAVPLARSQSSQALNARGPATATEQELMRLVQQYNDAQVKGDRQVLERLWADDYLYTHSNGAVMNKPQDIADATSGEMTWTAARLDDMKVRLFGDVGVVTGRLIMEGRAANYASGPRRFTDVFVRRNGRWQLVGGQTTMLAPK